MSSDPSSGEKKPAADAPSEPQGVPDPEAPVRDRSKSEPLKKEPLQKDALKKETHIFRLKIFKCQGAVSVSLVQEERKNDEEEEDEGDDDKEEEKVKKRKRIEPKKDRPLTAIPTTTLEFRELSLQSFKAKRLSDIRERLTGVIKQPFHFCIEDVSTVEDSRTLGSYFNELSVPPAEDASRFHLYIKCFEREEQRRTMEHVLRNPPFVLKFFQRVVGDPPGNKVSIQDEGSLLSSALKGRDAAKMTMRELRKLIHMSSNPELHQFCLDDDTVVSDDATLGEYVSMMHGDVDVKDIMPPVDIYFRKPGTIKKSRFSKASPEVIKALAKLGVNKDFNEDWKEQELQRNKKALTVDEELDMSDYAVKVKSLKPTKLTSQMDENDWLTVIRNCNLMFGWRVDAINNQIVRASKPAFRLRDGVNMYQPPSKPVKPSAPSKPPGGKVNVKDGKAGDKTASKSDDSEDDEDEDDADEEGDEEDKQDEESNDNGSTEGSDDEDTTAASEADSEEELDETNKPKSLPAFIVNDGSKTQVSVVSHAFEESMAKNHFTSTSFEASASGAYAGVSAAASTAFAQQHGEGHKESKQNYQKTLVATYRFPRVTVYLRPEDLEPTEELKNAIDQVRKTKDVNNLRKLHASFGHLFCHEVVLGGCLQTTKVVKKDVTETESEQRDQFKSSVGLAVQTPAGVGGSMKAERETADAKSHGKKQIDQSEFLTFEATGGNTILASNPPEWCASVIDFNDWRVIEQCELSPLAHAIAQMPGLRPVKEWFLQAVPTISKYLIVPESRTLDVRLKVSTSDEGISRIAGRKINSYLIHDPERPVWPLRTHLKKTEQSQKQSAPLTYVSNGRLVVDVTQISTQVDTMEDHALFSPARTQAPVLLHYEDGYYGTALDNKFKQSIWTIEIPYGYNLAHGSLISIKSASKFLTVYRNQQGVFLPALTSHGDPSYWRVLKAQEDQENSNLVDGDVVRFSWSFSDQLAGFRDFLDDSFGRRCFTKPDGVENALYLKVPYPRFEKMNSTDGMALVMCGASETKPVVESVKVVPLSTEDQGSAPTINYNYHDLSFRLDTVGNNGRGGSLDYMTSNINMSAVKEEQSIINREMKFTSQGPTLSVPEQVVAGLLGPQLPFGGMLKSLGMW